MIQPYYSDESELASHPPSLTPPPSHAYRPIHPSLDDELDSWIVSFKDETLMYQCTYPTCKGRRDSKTKQHVPLAIFTSKSNARNHVRRDMDIVDAFRCNCGQTFGSEDSAKRHCNTKSAGKVHECPECGHCFERKDYWEVHVKERKCRRAHRLQVTTPAQHSPSPSWSSSDSESPSPVEPHHPEFSPQSSYSPVSQYYDTDCSLIDLDSPSPSPTSYNQPNYLNHHHQYNSYYASGSSSVTQGQYHSPHPNANAMNYLSHHIGHTLQSHPTYASAAPAYYT